MEFKNAKTILDQPAPNWPPAFPKWRPGDREFLYRDGDPVSRVSFLDSMQITGWARVPGGLKFFYRKRAV